MSVTIRDVEYIAELARLRLTDAEKETYAGQLNSILAYMEKLGTLDTANVEPLSHVLEATNVMREDRETPSLPPEKVLENAPDRREKFFRVPRVVGGR
jgi:aspartyl-tRNA(Asn)/glutamyl-tRNA(Gln) amidotransferase subunit C